MKLDLLTAISPIDGRYRGKTERLADYFSEYALIRYRVRVEIEYFITLCELPLPQLASFDHQLFERLRDIYRNFGEEEAQRVKDIEKVTNHDVKAVEYFIKEEFDRIGGLDAYKEFIHFGLTSQDINNTSVPLSIKEALEQFYYPLCEELIAQLRQYAEEWAAVPMLAKTHGQPASPTRLGKEVMVFVYRLEEQLRQLKECRLTAKFGGATGNYNAHHVAYPEYDWKAFGNRFVSEKLGLEREQFTTQISNYDCLGSVFDAMRRINTIIIDLDRDFWMYISMEYFKQKIKAGEVGSSAMPHRLYRAAQRGRTVRPRRNRNREHTQGPAQAHPQRGEAAGRPQQHMGSSGRGYTDNTSSRGLSASVRGTESTHTHQQAHDRGDHPRVHTDTQRERRCEGGVDGYHTYELHRHLNQPQDIIRQ